MSTQLRATDYSAPRFNSLQNGGGSQARAYAQPRTQPQSVPVQAPTKKVSRKIAESAAGHRSILANAGAVVAAVAVVGLTFLNGRIQLANEAHRSIAVTQRLNQAMDMAHYWQNRQARVVTPTTIGHMAEKIQMVHPQEHDVVVFP